MDDATAEGQARKIRRARYRLRPAPTRPPSNVPPTLEGPPTLDEDAATTADDGQAAAWRRDRSGVRALPQRSPGEVVGGRYRLGAELGRGHVGVVYAAQDLTTGRCVAVKLATAARLRAMADDAVDARIYARMQREYTAARRASHPHAAEVLDVGVDDPTGDGYLTYVLVPGPTLRDELARRGTLPPAEAVALAVPLLRALAAGHRAGVVHRDVKPSNVIVSEGDGGAPRAVLVDWSVAHLVDGSGERVTQEGMAVGTPEYMAPEAVRGTLSVSAAVDVWGVGVMLYEMLAGRTPFAADNPTATLCRIATETAPRLDTHRDDVLGALADAVAKALAPDVGSRHASADAFADVLLAATVPSSLRPSGTRVALVPPPPDTRVRRVRLPWSWADKFAAATVVAAVSFVCGVALAAVMATTPRVAPSPPTMVVAAEITGPVPLWSPPKPPADPRAKARRAP